jgi:hypothetical protein
MTSPKGNPYCAFKDDRERTIALISKDIRWMVIAVATSTGAGSISWPMLLRLFS